MPEEQDTTEHIEIIIFLKSLVTIYGGKSTIDRFWEKTSKKGESDCWNWLGAKTKAGYGFMGIKGHTVGAHRFSYILSYGSLSKNFSIDHLCRNRSRVNPRHLEAVSPVVNSNRGKTYRLSAYTRCKNGHDLNELNIYWTKKGTRKCRKCHTERERLRRGNPTACKRNHPYTEETIFFDKRGRKQCRTCMKAKRARGPSRTQKTHCKFGHIFSEPTTYISKLGRRVCRLCNNRNQKAYRQTEEWSKWYANRKLQKKEHSHEK